MPHAWRYTQPYPGVLALFPSGQATHFLVVTDWHTKLWWLQGCHRGCTNPDPQSPPTATWDRIPCPGNRSGDQREDRGGSHGTDAGHHPKNTLAISCSHLSDPLDHLLNLFSYAFSASDHTDAQVSFLWFFHCTSQSKPCAPAPHELPPHTQVVMFQFVGKSGEPPSLTVLDVTWPRGWCFLGVPGEMPGVPWRCYPGYQHTLPATHGVCGDPFRGGGGIIWVSWLFFISLCSSFLIDICCFVT